MAGEGQGGGERGKGEGVIRAEGGEEGREEGDGGREGG